MEATNIGVFTFKCQQFMDECKSKEYINSKQFHKDYMLLRTYGRKLEDSLNKLNTKYPNDIDVSVAMEAFRVFNNAVTSLYRKIVES